MKYRAIAISIFILGLLVVATPALADGPDGNDYQGMTIQAYLPLIQKNYPSDYTPSTTTTVLIPCEDATRGALYRQLVTDTANTWAWPYAWSVSACSTCSEGVAYDRGFYLGSGMANIPSIIAKVFQLVLSVAFSGVSNLLDMMGLVDSAATSYDISCADDAEYICIGIAMIVSVDDMSGGWLTAIVTLVVAVMGFYLATYAIKEIRSILDTSQSGGGEE